MGEPGCRTGLDLILVLTYGNFYANASKGELFNLREHCAFFIFYYFVFLSLLFSSCYWKSSANP